MLYRHENYQESYVHICDDAHKDTRKAIADRPRITVHDVHAYIETYSGFGLEPIKFCPYCGKELDSDERTNEFYKF